MTPTFRSRMPLGRIGVLLTLALGACTHTGEETTTASIPNDYRQRHPIALQEADRSVNVFVGAGRGGLTAPQRADIAVLGQTWVKEGTGAITIDVPQNAPNARSASDTAHEISALLGATGVPSRGIVVRKYQPTDERTFAAIRVTYPRITATAGPCGVWPDDLGPSIKNKAYFENKPYWNLGCASQRNLASMIDNPSDLAQPRAETPAYMGRRTTTFDTYRTATPPADKTVGISGVGQ